MLATEHDGKKIKKSHEGIPKNVSLFSKQYLVHLDEDIKQTSNMNWTNFYTWQSYPERSPN
jgi:hypothetical protein